MYKKSAPQFLDSLLPVNFEKKRSEKQAINQGAVASKYAKV